MAEIKLNIEEGGPRKTNTAKEIEKIPVKKIVKKDAVVSAKKPFSKKMLGLMFGEDVTDYKKYFIEEVLIPGCKSLAWDLLEGTIFADVSGGRRRTYNYRNNIINDVKRYTKNRMKYSSSGSKKNGYEQSNKIDPTNIVLRNRRDAEDVVAYLQQRIVDCGAVSVAEFLNTMDLESRWTDNDWGWTNPNDIGIKHVSGGWLIDVAEMEHLE